MSGNKWDMDRSEVKTGRQAKTKQNKTNPQPNPGRVKSIPYLHFLIHGILQMS